MEYFPPRDDTSNYFDLLDWAKDGVISDLNSGDYTGSEETADRIIKEGGISDLDKNSVHYERLCRELLKADIKLIKVEKKQLSGDYTDDINSLVAKKMYETAQPIDSDYDGELLSSVIKHYVTENENDNWTEKSKQEIESSLNLFLDVIGDVPIGTIIPIHYLLLTKQRYFQRKVGHTFLRWYAALCNDQSLDHSSHALPFLPRKE